MGWRPLSWLSRGEMKGIEEAVTEVEVVKTLVRILRA